VMGTVNILECIRLTEGVRSVLNITTDKVYFNNEWCWGYRETDELNGFDPYSNSKSCSELVTSSYHNSFFLESDVAVSTARAGNVIGGGDFSDYRIIPDCIRAATKSETIVVRNPHSTRPYQHVLDSLFAYLMIAEQQYEDKGFSGSYNVGPEDTDYLTTGQLVQKFCDTWGSGQEWKTVDMDTPHEASFLKLDCSKIKTIFGWMPHWGIDDSMIKTIDWTKEFYANNSVDNLMDAQISEFLKIGD